MLVKIENNKIVGNINISPANREQEFLENNPSYVKTDFNFVEDLALYEYKNNTFSLVENWEELKEAKRVASLPSLEELKLLKIKELHEKDNEAYEAYLNFYPTKEVKSFEAREKEAFAYKQDNNAPTPIIDALVGYNPAGDLATERAKKEEHIDAVLAKVAFIARSAGILIEKRDVIKACNSIQELEQIEI